MARFEDVDALEKAVGPMVTITRGPDGFAILEPKEGATDDGDFPSFIEDEDGNEVDLWDVVVEHLAPDSVLVVQSIGADKLRYLSGNATAFVRRADGTVEAARIGIDDIYAKAAEQFSISVECIGVAQYEDLPKCLESPPERTRPSGG